MTIKTEIRHTSDTLELVLYDDEETGAAVVLTSINDLENVRQAIDETYKTAVRLMVERDRRKPHTRGVTKGIRVVQG